MKSRINRRLKGNIKDNLNDKGWNFFQKKLTS